jgi:hypothetical protein
MLYIKGTLWPSTQQLTIKHLLKHVKTSYIEYIHYMFQSYQIILRW